MEPIVNYKRLNSEAPDWEKLELEYRPDAKDAKASEAGALYTQLVIVLVALGLTLLARIIAPLIIEGHLGTVGTIFNIGFGASFTIALGVLWTTKGNWRMALAIFILLWWSSIIAIFLYYVTNYTTTLLLIFAGAVFMLYRLIDGLYLHTVYWLTAHERVSHETRRQRREWYKNRFNAGRLHSFIREMEAELSERTAAGDEEGSRLLRLRIEELHGLKKYRAMLIGFPFLFFILPILPLVHFNSWLTLIVPAFLSVVIVSRLPFRRCFYIFRRSLIHWFQYGLDTNPVPGIYFSPAGRTPKRIAKSAFTAVLLSMSLIPLAHFFPLVIELTGQRALRKPFISGVTASHSMLQTSLETSHIGLGPIPEELRDSPPDFDLSWGSEVRAQQAAAERQAKLKRLETQWADEQIESYLRRIKAGWVFIAIDGVLFGHSWTFYPLVLGFLGCLFIVPLVIGTTFIAAAGRSLSFAYDALHGADAPEHDADLTSWDCRVAHLLASENQKEREHLWLGLNAAEDYPVLLDRRILNEHAYIVGDTGSGKTALGLSPIVTQLLRQGDAGMVIIDLKGDSALFQAVKMEAEAKGLDFKFFTNELGKTTYAFNPFSQANIEHLSLNQFCETILESLNLNHGEGYGRSYFSRVARRWLTGTLRVNSHIHSFKELYVLAQDPKNFVNEEEQKDAFELIAVIESLASFEQLNITGRSGQPPAVVQNAIYMPDVISKPQVVYFWLPAAVESASVREIAKLALYALLASAYAHARKHGQPAQTYLVIDEFQRIASENFKIILEQARSMGVGAILANQTFADLKTNDTDLRPAVQANTRFKLCFSATDLDQQDTVIKSSGEKTKWQFSFTEGSSGVSSFTRKETVVPRIGRNDVIIISDHPLYAVAHISRGSRYSQYSGFSFPVLMEFHITNEEYQRRMALPWPDATEATLTNWRPPIPPDEFPSTESRLAKEEALFGSEEEKSEPGAPAKPVPAGESGWVERLAKLQNQFAGPTPTPALGPTLMPEPAVTNPPPLPNEV